MHCVSCVGVSEVETTSFVSARWVPQMADHRDVCLGLRDAMRQAHMDSVRRSRSSSAREPVLSVLVPNERGFSGLEEVVTAGAPINKVAVFTTASEAFCQRNINCSIAESLKRFEPVIAKTKDQGFILRGYVSTVLGCPVQGDVPLGDVVDVVAKLFDMGCDEVSLGDTIGVGTPEGVADLLGLIEKHVCPVDDGRIALHMHDTNGRALSNIRQGLVHGVRNIDASVGGLGGCPYADGATGNVATEDVVALLQETGVETTACLETLAETGLWICHALGRPYTSPAGLAALGYDKPVPPPPGKGAEGDGSVPETK